MLVLVGMGARVAVHEVAMLVLVGMDVGVSMGMPMLVRVAVMVVVLTTVILYVLACDPLPPCPGKVREMLMGTASSRVPA